MMFLAIWFQFLLSFGLALFSFALSEMDVPAWVAAAAFWTAIALMIIALAVAHVRFRRSSSRAKTEHTLFDLREGASLKRASADDVVVEGFENTTLLKAGKKATAEDIHARNYRASGLRDAQE